MNFTIYVKNMCICIYTRFFYIYSSIYFISLIFFFLIVTVIIMQLLSFFLIFVHGKFPSSIVYSIYPQQKLYPIKIHMIEKYQQCILWSTWFCFGKIQILLFLRKSMSGSLWVKLQWKGFTIFYNILIFYWNQIHNLC